MADTPVPESSTTENTNQTPPVPSTPAPTSPEPSTPPAPDTPPPADNAPKAPAPPAVAQTPAPADNTQQAPATPAPTAPAKKSSKRLFLIIGVLAVVGVSALLAVMLAAGPTKKATVSDKSNETDAKPTIMKQSEKTKDSDINNPQAFSRMFVYGAWSGQTSVIKAVELSTQTTTLLASLPSTIKKVSVLSAETLFYIDQTDRQDHGKQLVIYDIKSKSPRGSIPASNGFGIDDYVLSPDKKFVAIWEVSFAPNAQILQGGKSRVSVVDLGRPTVKKLLYDEVAGPTSPVHYPRAVLNNGRVFADKFLPNDPKAGAGWAYGLSVVDFDGTNRQDLPQMPAGTYGTQPSLSPDGKYLVFSGYDGSRGDGNAAANGNGFRQAILTPNTIELLDTENFNRQKLPNLDNKNIYSASGWDTATGKIILTAVSPDANTTGVYSYDLTDKTPVKIDIPSTESAKYGFLTQITNNTTVIGTQDTNDTNLGNLGDSYTYPFTQVALLDAASSKVSFVPLEDTFAQYITILPGNYFKSVLGLQAYAQTVSTKPVQHPTFVDLFSAQNDTKTNQQLSTFIVKYDLADIRQTQQSDNPNLAVAPEAASPAPSGGNPNGGGNKGKPKCKDLATQQCAEQGMAAASPQQADCVKTNFAANKAQKSSGSGLCSDSPLYLYGPAGLAVNTTIQTPIFDVIPAAESNVFDVILNGNGKFTFNNNEYASITYDYFSNVKKVTAPARGIIAKRENVQAVLLMYAEKLGLNKKETDDLIVAGKAKATASYVFVSFFDQKTSESILPIAFTPQPDNYRNVVFYFKNLAAKPTYTPLPPVFPEQLKRTGFTAVEISELVE